MLSKKALMLVTAGLVTLGVNAYAQAPSQRTGFVNSNKIFQELPEAREAQARLDAIIKPIKDELEVKQKELQAKYEEYQKKEAMMNEAAKRTAQQEILQLEQQYNMFRQEKLGTDGELAQQQEKILAPIKDKILKAIERVAKDEKYTFVFDQNDQLQVLLFADPTHDLTFKVIDKLRRGR